MFGRKSEKIDPDQFELTLEDIETAIAQVEAEGEANPLVMPTQTATPRKANRGSLPRHLPRIEEVIEPESTLCDCGCERDSSRSPAVSIVTDHIDQSLPPLPFHHMDGSLECSRKVG